MPPGLSPDAACGVLVAGTSALLMLRDVARLEQGERVFVAAGAGGVGSFAVQLARHLGAAQVIAGVGSAEKGAAAMAAGADAVVTYGDAHWPDAVRELTGGAGVDVLLEMRGGPSLEQGLPALAPFGRAVVYGAASNERYTLSTAALGAWLEVPALNQSIHAFNLGLWFALRAQAAGAAIGSLIGLLAQGIVRPPAIERLPLSRAADAHARLEGRATTGKLVLIPEA
jgi:NADPH:quinone reductase-like Zn-dependent oxidoreductase